MSALEVRLLIVDDDEDMRAMLAEFLARMGLVIKQAANLAEAQRLIRNEADPFDLVFADLRLPDGSGMEVVRAAHARKPDTLVTIATGYASLESAIEAIRLGAYDYLTKPFTLDQVGVQVRNMMQRVLLSKENARLSLRLQELYQEFHRLQTQRVETSRFHDEIRRQLAEIDRKLDRLMTSCPGAALAVEASSAADRHAVPTFLLGPAESDDGKGPAASSPTSAVPELVK